MSEGPRSSMVASIQGAREHQHERQESNFLAFNLRSQAREALNLRSSPDSILRRQSRRPGQALALPADREPYCLMNPFLWKIWRLRFARYEHYAIQYHRHLFWRFWWRLPEWQW